MKKISLSLFACLFFNLIYSQKNILFENDKTQYSIYLVIKNKDTSAYQSEALTKLLSLLKQVSGIDFTLSKEKDLSKKQIVIQPGLSAYHKPVLQNKNGDFRISISSKEIRLEGEAEGMLYAVSEFAETFLRCRYYANDAVLIPQQDKCVLPDNFLKTYISSNTFRINYNGQAFNSEYSQWHKLHNEARKNNLSNNSQWGMWVHTLFKLVPPDVYFDSHPEYYSLRNGARIKDQLCLSNPLVLQITIDSLKKQISRNPQAKYWSVSQMDNYNFCECDNCKKIDAADGSAAGSLIQFVNKVAAAFPDKIISTLAYQYSRKAPLKTKPGKNVNIMLCTIECDRSKPIADDKRKGSFYDDLKNWSALTKNIIIWDYVINFSNTCSPFPNLHVLKPNLQLFKKMGVQMNFQQGWPSFGGEMEELRTYLISKLLWNPDINIDSIKNEFLKGYYEAAAPFIKSILDTMQFELKKSGRPLLIYEHPFAHREDYLSPELIKYYHEQLANAFFAVHSESKLLKRIDKFAQSFRYADIEVAKMMINTVYWIFEKKENNSLGIKNYYDSLLNEFAAKCKIFGPPSLHETSLPPAEYETKTRNYFNTAIEPHLAVDVKISFNQIYNSQYKANGPQSLIDGIHGFEKWEALWQGWWGKDLIATIDLGTAKKIQQVKMNFMNDNQSWILAPASLKLEISEDGKNFTDAGTVINKNAGAKLEKQIVPLELNLNSPVQAKFIRVTVKNIGKLPVWRGVNGEAWLFTDEIVVK